MNPTNQHLKGYAHYELTLTEKNFKPKIFIERFKIYLKEKIEKEAKAFVTLQNNTPFTNPKTYFEFNGRFFQPRYHGNPQDLGYTKNIINLNHFLEEQIQLEEISDLLVAFKTEKARMKVRIEPESRYGIGLIVVKGFNIKKLNASVPKYVMNEFTHAMINAYCEQPKNKEKNLTYSPKLIDITKNIKRIKKI